MTTNADAGAAAATTAAATAAAPAVAAGGAAGGAPVSLTSLNRHFGAVRALDGLTVDVAPGELVALLGPSGCGKTTALRILAGFETADSGTVTVDGKEISHIPASRRDMGMVFQSYSLFPNMSALDNVGFGLRLRKKSGAERKRRAGELLDMVGLAKQAGQFPHQLSGGQQQRVALARALAIEPRVLLLDEPLSALDAKVRLQLREQIRALQQRLGTTTLFVTHDQEEALSMSDRVGVMKDGKLEQIATPSDLYSEPATAFVAEFVGTMNRIPGRLDGTGDQVSALGQTVPVTGGAADALAGDVDVLVRPEGLTIAAGPNGNGIVADRTFLGSTTRISVLLDGDHMVKVDRPSTVAAGLPPGTSVQISLPGSAVLVSERR
ncbi:MAG TPA: ABC transporter ATP-binding protein [Streptosporangiaceae bacterium]